jgi:putative toxin-antitoxin system antitoxin component (TIGR02293 family)
MSTVKSPTNTTYRARAQSHNAGLREPNAAYEANANQAALRPAKTLRNVGKVAEKPHADTSAKPVRHTKFGLTVLPRVNNSASVMDETDTPLADLAAHDLVTRGLPIADVRALMDRFQFIAHDTVLSTLGVSERTLQRADASGKTLDSNVSDRALRLSAVTDQAIAVLGNQDAAEHWLLAPALGLSQRRPIDLLQSTEGTNLVKTLLTRMDYGVYS